MVKAIFFDFFGVIMPDLLDEWLRTKGIARDGRIETAAIDANMGRIDRETFMHVLSEGAGVPVEQVRNEYQALATPNPEVVPIIETTHKSYPTVLISNADSQHLRSLLDEFDLERLFDHIIISGETGAMKPHHEIYETALKRVDADPQNVIFTDDRPANIEGARRVGIEKSFVFTDSQQLRKQLREYNVQLDNS